MNLFQESHICKTLLCHQETFRKTFSHFEFCQKGKFQWMKNSMEENPRRFPAFDPWVSKGTSGSNHMLNRLFGSLVLASGGRSSDPTWPLDKGKALTTTGMEGGFFSPPMESLILNRVCLAELRSTPILRARTHRGQGSAAFDTACGKRQARCPHNLPTALSPTVPLNLPKRRTTSPGMTGRERLYGWENGRKRTWRWAGGLH